MTGPAPDGNAFWEALREARGELGARRTCARAAEMRAQRVMWGEIAQELGLPDRVDAFWAAQRHGLWATASLCGVMAHMPRMRARWRAAEMRDLILEEIKEQNPPEGPRAS